MVAEATINKSQAIRDYLKKNKKAMPTAVVAALKEQGVEVNAQLVSNVKNALAKGKVGRVKRSTVGAGSEKPGRPQKAKLERGGKSQAIRAEFETKGLTTRPVDVIAALAAQGIEVTSGQVVTVRKSMGGKGQKRRKNKAARQIAQPTTNGATLNISDLLAAKKLAEQVGGIEVARKALEALSRLA